MSTLHGPLGSLMQAVAHARRVIQGTLSGALYTCMKTLLREHSIRFIRPEEIQAEGFHELMSCGALA